MASETIVSTGHSDHEDVEEVYKWLEETAERMGLGAKLYTQRATQNHNWIYLPVYVPGDDIFDMADKLQKLEDEWRNQEPEPYWELLLIPAAR